MDMLLVVARNVPCTCLDQIDADHGVAIIKSMLESLKLVPSWSYQMYFSKCSFYDQHYPFLSPTDCLSHTLSLGLSAILLSSPPFPFDMKCCSTIWWSSINKRIPQRTVLIFKGNINKKKVLELKPGLALTKMDGIRLRPRFQWRADGCR